MLFYFCSVFLLFVFWLSMADSNNNIPVPSRNNSCGATRNGWSFLFFLNPKSKACPGPRAGIQNLKSINPFIQPLAFFVLFLAAAEVLTIALSLAHVAITRPVALLILAASLVLAVLLSSALCPLPFTLCLLPFRRPAPAQHASVF